MISYKLRKDNLFHRNIGSYSSYGIDAFDDSSSNPIHSILDISTEKDSLENLICLCNESQLDIVHLDDVVEDFLT
jgi:hypothetical protein